MYLAVKLSKFEVKDWVNRQPHHHNWWDQFVDDLEASDLEEICHQVLDLYMQVCRFILNDVFLTIFVRNELIDCYTVLNI
jgi:hypothetical protein